MRDILIRWVGFSFLVLSLGATEAKKNNVDGLLLRALNTSEQIKRARDQSGALADIGVNLMRASHPQEAMQAFNKALAKSTESQMYPWAKVKAYVIQKMAEAGLFNAAVQAADQMPDSKFKDAALVETAIQLAQAGYLEQAVTLEEQIVLARFRTMMLNSLAEVALNSHGSKNPKEMTTLQTRMKKYEELYQEKN
jgi:hypothetical protein